MMIEAMVKTDHTSRNTNTHNMTHLLKADYNLFLNVFSQGVIFSMKLNK